MHSSRVFAVLLAVAASSSVHGAPVMQRNILTPILGDAADDVLPAIKALGGGALAGIAGKLLGGHGSSSNSTRRDILSDLQPIITAIEGALSGNGTDAGGIGSDISSVLSSLFGGADNSTSTNSTSSGVGDMGSDISSALGGMLGGADNSTSSAGSSSGSATGDSGDDSGSDSGDDSGDDADPNAGSGGDSSGSDGASSRKRANILGGLFKAGEQDLGSVLKNGALSGLGSGAIGLLGSLFDGGSSGSSSSSPSNSSRRADIDARFEEMLRRELAAAVLKRDLEARLNVGGLGKTLLGTLTSFLTSSGIEDIFGGGSSSSNSSRRALEVFSRTMLNELD